MSTKCQTDRKKIYFAAPLFSEAELSFNKRTREKLARYCDVYLPQEDGGLLSQMISQGMSSMLAIEKIFKMDLRAIEKSDILLIVLDGRTIDEGAAFELGYAYALKKECIGLQTDSRRLLSTGNNPMIDKALSQVFSSIDEVVAWIGNIESKVAL